MESDLVENELVFSGPVLEEVSRYGTGEVCSLFSVDSSYTPSSEDLQRFADICNQPSIYNAFFKDQLRGEKYSLKGAENFIKSCQLEWKKQKVFTFLVKNSAGSIVAVVSIKSPDKNSAEIGYWSSEDFKGIMTNAVIKVTEVAKKAGFKSLFGKTISSNANSLGVLERAGFAPSEDVELKGILWRVRKLNL